MIRRPPRSTPLSLHDALPISILAALALAIGAVALSAGHAVPDLVAAIWVLAGEVPLDRESTRLNSSHQIISYAAFSLEKKNNQLSDVADRFQSQYHQTLQERT